MIIILHNKKRIVRIVNKNQDIIKFETSEKLVKDLFRLSNKYQKSIIIWCHESL